jgi:hypothetical protein
MTGAVPPPWGDRAWRLWRDGWSCAEVAERVYRETGWQVIPSAIESYVTARAGAIIALLYGAET